MIGRSKSAYCGPYSSMTTPRSSTRYSSPSMRPMPIGCALRHHHFDRRRQRPPQRRVAHPRRRQQPPRHASRSVHTMFSPRRPLEHRQHLAARQPLVAAHDDPIDLQHARVARRLAHAAIERRHREQRRRCAYCDHRPRAAARQPAALARRLHVRAAEAPVGRSGDRAHGVSRGARPRAADQHRSGTRADRSGAQRDHHVAGPRDPRQRRRHIVEPRHDVDRHRTVALRIDAASASSVTPGIGSSPAA